MTVNSSADSVILIVFAFSDNLSAENSNCLRSSATAKTTFLDVCIFSKSEVGPSLFCAGHKVRLAELHMAEQPEANMDSKQKQFSISELRVLSATLLRENLQLLLF